MLRTKKGQMEMIGLTIIVIIVLIGILFGIRFVLKAEQSEVGIEFRQSQLAANMLNTLAGTTTDCNGLTFTQLVQDCAVVCTLDCSRSGITSVITDVFRDTLDSWGKHYHFTISRIGIDERDEDGDGCPDEKETKTYPIATRAGTAVMRLELC